MSRLNLVREPQVKFDDNTFTFISDLENEVEKKSRKDSSVQGKIFGKKQDKEFSSMHEIQGLKFLLFIVSTKK